MFVTLAVATAVLALPPMHRWSMKRRPPIDEQQLFLGVHGELRAGASLRNAIAAAAQGQRGAIAADIHRAATSPEPMTAVCSALRRLPEMGSTAAMATRVAMESGGRAADVFLRLADRARVNTDLRRQRKSLTAQARLSASIVGCLPLLWFVFGGWNRLQVLINHGGGIVAAAGIGMEALGVALVWRLAAT
jgi:tight adherence protein B